jgi:hypothetical protein
MSKDWPNELSLMTDVFVAGTAAGEPQGCATRWW